MKFARCQMNIGLQLKFILTRDVTKVGFTFQRDGLRNVKASMEV